MPLFVPMGLKVRFLERTPKSKKRAIPPTVALELLSQIWDTCHRHKPPSISSSKQRLWDKDSKEEDVKENDQQGGEDKETKEKESERRFRRPNSLKLNMIQMVTKSHFLAWVKTIIIYN